MKFSIVKYLFFSLLAFLMMQCAVIKNRKREEAIMAETKNIPMIQKFIDTDKEGFNLFNELSGERKWVDSVYNSLSFEEKLGQLFMVAAYSNKDSIHFNSLDKLIKNYKIGGLIFFQGGPMRQAKLTNRFQANSKIPLFIGNDAEWGLNMRLDSTYAYPWNMTLGAVQDMKLIEQLGERMAKETKRMGLQFNFAPVIDINTNPNNPIIGNRSFGENKEEVTKRAVALMKGVQSQGVFATGKHFPGHGDTETDSHHTLPVVNFTKERIDSVEFYPYKKMFNLGLSSVMVAHLNVPSLEERQNYPSSISYNIVTNTLKKELGFKGLIFTDALNMKGASSFKKPGDIDLEAFLAGNDIMLFAEDVPSAITKFTQAYNDKIITDERIEHSVKKILSYKYKAGLNNYKPIEITGLLNDLNAPEASKLQYNLYENAITVLKNEHTLLPIKDLTKAKIAYVKLGDDSGNVFLSTLKKYAQVEEMEEKNLDSLLVNLKEFNTVIIGYHKSDRAWRKHDFSEKDLLWLEKIAAQNNVILDVFAKPYTLLKIKSFDDIEGLIVSYQNGDIPQTISAELIFGAVEAKGKLPVSIKEYFKVGEGITTEKINRLGFSSPEGVGMNSYKLKEIDDVVKKAIDDKITPGAQVLVARKGKVIYHKSFGYHTYEQDTKVKNTDIYDIASLSKIIGTLPNVMMDYDKGEINLATHLGQMVHKARGTNKDSIVFKELLSHYARLKAWEPFYKQTIDSITKKPSEKLYRQTLTEGFTTQVSENLFLTDSYRDSIISKIMKSKLLPKKEYKYSDFTFILLKEYLETHHNKTLDNLAYENFFSKIGMNYTMYNPLKKVDIDQIPPTEKDTYYRQDLIQGYVHDMAAAMQGGVAGHAGLFSNASDIAKMMQLYLNKGNYGGTQFFSSKTMDDFNTCYFCTEGNRRGIGFDKPQLKGEGPTCGCASITSFGHTGFTGTMTWADPEKELIYVFLSNRTFPDSNLPNKLAKENTRERIQQIIYDSIFD
ncbi:beta-N-acetylglucosaminidase [Flavobacterium davisii]|uniref:beta-N-acetylhexosaminidase n=2 Tax=Flavobacterium davisii TaxID=2906077 RepID=A0A246GHL5_9FLAO|nr:glycoside hydrolase family 3 N-terminal domain-containing protein [Flavobacterium davisii]OWP83691.1 beta-N-acetylglucosaminidase [Flavobacterium davisii]